MTGKVGLFYGTDTGNTERVAELIKEKLEEKIGEGQVDVYDVATASPEDFDKYQYIILGQPTWYYGELQSSWDEFWDDFKKVDFTGKKVACFGLGDQADYSEYFLDAMGMMHDVAVENGAEPVGYWPTDGYEFDASKAVTEDGEFFVGLAIDEDQQPELTEERVSQWVDQIVEEMGLA
ncbi:flavodoxin I [Sulfurivirga caldicuralii]|jgi:flavodoxin I|uniref:Flavodoxin n=1 Tax=Sulfurivirga caldicuralii TaxID=364032 RepID=A0A1N6EWN3_9GAMM|nr:flavodoxin [Sulfurivirga caldicuralii]SIN87361.1 flavodoxin I [Sulfurivirga caldicuralii]